VVVILLKVKHWTNYH